ncbi:hypothetical protein ACTI_85600 [Actinoplanes sp. OR16]|uniref:hypothetical protein n=1 Tax=Actinoplanes sp. OR16 TaxID=946334 RepID=UPI000F6DBB4D|nr:hypothetical protein [Actinoplanes sp. OR16]BBH71875.1 hypothetical protein ACTI_85600 [Actinoplanes sp. OR16]
MLNTTTYFGTDGTLVLSDARDFDADAFALLLPQDGQVARVTNVTLALRMDLRPFHEMGARYPSELRAGNIAISGTVERAYINGALLRLMIGQYAIEPEAAGLPIPSFTMKLAVDNLAPAGEQGNSILTVYGVMFDSWQANLPEDDFMLERLTFAARRIQVDDKEIEG